MAHQKVYGICEDKCKVEVPQGSIMVLESTMTVSSSVSRKNLALPDGFTKDNTVVLGIMIGSSQQSPTWNFNDESFTARVAISSMVNVTLESNYSPTGKEYPFKVILYRYE